ncbi:non-canonical purine NTP pyrophosphatase [Stutzerimonas urumqiensis]|uniref:non-canonical purine NTP pyrophosphatase n=1 Tax=Stutzerimonas urumqiensis TaxID=638269 RepID=UPI000EB15E74|nr:non-canonical purine NTP pyrophosphatase [Stutzerimonas urumqiensis]
MKIRFACSNERKTREVCDIAATLGLDVRAYPLEHEELHSDDIEQLADINLLAAFRLLGKPVFVEYSGLEIPSLNGFPGGLTQRLWDMLQAERFAALIGQFEDPRATARSVIGYCDGRKRHFFEGRLDGRIVTEPAADRSSQWDSVFVPEGYDRTLADLGEQKNELSMRRRALEAFASFLRAN